VVLQWTTDDSVAIRFFGARHAALLRPQTWLGDRTVDVSLQLAAVDSLHGGQSAGPASNQRRRMRSTAPRLAA
jgi:hypothetical protein